MVDALTQITKLLKPDGLLIDIHPQDIILPIYVQIGAATTEIGAIDVESKFAKYRRADEAINIVVQNETYSLRHKTVVDFLIYFDTVAECRQYLEEEWSDAKLSESNWAHMKFLMSQGNAFKQIFYSEGVKFCCLAPASAS